MNNMNIFPDNFQLLDDYGNKLLWLSWDSYKAAAHFFMDDAF